MKLQLGVNYCSNIFYHSDKSWLSSSSLKTLLQSPKKYYDEHVLGIKEEAAENSAFIEGSLTHSMILEEDKVAQEYAFFDGLRKQGKEFEDFKAANPGKTIISAAQKGRVAGYVRAFKNNPAAVDLIKNGAPEYSICQVLDGVQCKMRADWINIEAGYIMDVKTSGFAVTHEEFKLTIEQYKYALSAAFYCKIAEQFYGKPFDFYFVAIAKKELDCQVYKVSELTRRKGNSEVGRALDIYKKCVQTGLWVADLGNAKKESKFEILEV
jgi:hypothetical protein